MSLDWIQIDIFTSTQGVEPVCAMLTDAGISGVSISDPADIEALIQSRSKSPELIDAALYGMRGGESAVTAYAAQNDQGTQMLERVNAGLERYRLTPDTQLREIPVPPLMEPGNYRIRSGSPATTPRSESVSQSDTFPGCPHSTARDVPSACFRRSSYSAASTPASSRRQKQPVYPSFIPSSSACLFTGT